jgi:hypothetical protein
VKPSSAIRSPRQVTQSNSDGPAVSTADPTVAASGNIVT